MKIFHAMDENSPIVSKEDKEKISILKIAEAGIFIKNVGVREGFFYIIPENKTDETYLDYKAAMIRIDKAFNIKMDRRIFEQKTMEFHNKKAEVVKRLMEMPK